MQQVGNDGAQDVELAAMIRRFVFRQTCIASIGTAQKPAQQQHRRSQTSSWCSDMRPCASPPCSSLCSAVALTLGLRWRAVLEGLKVVLTLEHMREYSSSVYYATIYDNV